MTGAEVAQLLTSFATLITAVVGLIAVLRKVEVIHRATNSMKDDLVKEVREASFAKGAKSEVDKK